MKIRNLESAFLANTNKILTKFVENKNSSLKNSYKMAVANKPLDINDGLTSHLYYTTGLLTFELLALATENFDQTNLNFADPAIKKMLDQAKKMLPSEFKNMNSAELLKLIRSSIAHNSETIQNTYTNNIKDYEIKLSKKGVTPADYVIALDDLVQLLETYDKCRVMDHIHGVLEHNDIHSIKDLLQKRKKLGSFDKILTYYDANGNIVPIDKYQDAAYLRFLLKHAPLINTTKKFDHYISRYFPAKDNKLNQYEHKYQLSMTVATLLDFGDKDILDPLVKSYVSNLKPEQQNSMLNYNITCNDMIKLLKKIDIEGMLPFVDKEFMQSILMSSVAFAIMSNRTNQELYDLYKEAGHETDIDTIRHTRNAFIHGRYFYNFNGAFEIYDGQKELQHVTTLNMNVIDDIYKKYVHKEAFEVLKMHSIIEAKLFEESINHQNKNKPKLDEIKEM